MHIFYSFLVTIIVKIKIISICENTIFLTVINTFILLFLSSCLASTSTDSHFLVKFPHSLSSRLYQFLGFLEYTVVELHIK